MVDPSIKILVADSFKHHQNVVRLWERFGLADRLIWRPPLTGGSSPIHAKEMIFTCVAPHYHPFGYQRAQQLLRIDRTVPLSERKKLVYLTRKVCLF